MSDNVPTFEDIGNVCNLGDADINWALEQLSLGSQTKGVVTRSNPTPVALYATEQAIKAVTIAGQHLLYVEVEKDSRQVLYVPLPEAVFGVAEKGEVVTLSAKVADGGVSISGKDEKVLGVSLKRIHQFVRATVIDYRRN